MAEYKINVIEKESTIEDKALNGLLHYAKDMNKKTKENVQNILADQLMKEHAIELVELEGKICCPRCRGVQNLPYDKYYCPFCGQKVAKVKKNEENTNTTNER